MFGPGASTTSSAFKAAYVPTTLGKVNVTESATKVVFTWPAPLSENGDAVTAYKLLILDGTGIYREQVSLCNGALASVIAVRSCSVEMIDLKDSLGLPLDMTIMAKAQAFNSKGWSLMPNDETTDVVKVKYKPNGAPTITTATSASSSSILL